MLNDVEINWKAAMFNEAKRISWKIFSCPIHFFSPRNASISMLKPQNLLTQIISNANATKSGHIFCLGWLNLCMIL